MPPHAASPAVGSGGGGGGGGGGASLARQLPAGPGAARPREPAHL